MARPLQLDRFPVQEQRPHEALALEVPASRYRISERAFPSRLPRVEYDEGVEVRSVDQEGRISFRGCRFRVGKAFSGDRVGLVPTETDGVWRVYYAQQRVWTVDLHATGLAGLALICNPSLRTGVTHLPGPYTRWGGFEYGSTRW